MKRKNNKGFTLIELLAVIVILGIVMVLTTRGVTALIKKTKSAAYTDAYQIIIKGLKTQLFANQAMGSNILTACNDGDSNANNRCYNKDEYKELYDSKEIALKIEAYSPSSITYAYYISVTPYGGNYKNVDISNASLTGTSKSSSDNKTLGTIMDKDTGEISTSATYNGSTINAHVTTVTHAE